MKALCAEPDCPTLIPFEDEFCDLHRPDAVPARAPSPGPSHPSSRRRRVCSQPSCPVISDEARCPKHRRQRGTTTQQGYGSAHQKRRKALLAVWLGRPCPICHTAMTDPRLMDACHSIPISSDHNSVADHMTCSTHNRAAGARLGTARRMARQLPPDNHEVPT